MSEPRFPEYMKSAMKSIHPAEEEWFDLCRGKVTAAERARLEQHLSVCADCREIYEDARAFADDDSQTPGAAPAMSAALEAEVERPPKVVAMPAPPRTRTPWAVAGIAAALAIGLGGLAWQARREAAEVREQLARARSGISESREEAARLTKQLGLFHQPNPAVATLFPLGSVVRSGSGGEEPRTIPANSVALVSLGEIRAAGPFRLQLREGKRVVERWENALRTADGDIRLFVGPLEAGSYEIEIEPGGAVYRMRIK